MHLPVYRRWLSKWLPIVLLILPTLSQAMPTTTLGVFAYRDADIVRERFTPVVETIQQALPGRKVELDVLSLDALDKAIAAGNVDFILTNPRHFLAVRQSHNVSGALATLKHYQGKRYLSSLAGVIITPSNSSLKTLDDLQDRIIGVPGKRFLGGFLTQAYEIHEHGYSPDTFADYRELGSHDAVISALLSGNIEAGFVRSGILEDWLAEGRLQPGQLSVISAYPASPYFPLAHSTRLYPEWALAAMPQVPMEDVRRVSNAVLQLTNISAGFGHSIAFDPPLDYLPVELAARKLGVAPFEFQDTTLWEHLKRFYGSTLWPMVGLAVSLILMALLLLILYLRKSLLFKRFNALFYFSPSAKLLFHINSQGQPVVIDSNLAAKTLFNISHRKSLKGKTVAELSPVVQPDGQPSSERAIELIRQASHQPQTFIWQLLDFNGEQITTKATLIKFRQGRMLQTLDHAPNFLVALNNITQQEKDHAELEAERNTLKNILWGTAAGTWEWNIQTGETRFDERWAEMVGYSLEALSPTTIDIWMTLCHPDDLPHSEAMLAEHFSGKRDAYDVEVRMRHRDGHWIWVQTRGRVVSFDANGAPLWMAGTHSEITLRKEAEAHAKAAIAQTYKHAALLPGMLYQYWLHPDGRTAFPYASRGIEDIYGVTPEQVKDDASAALSVIDHEDFDRIFATIKQSAETLTTWHATYRVNHPRGHQLWVEGIATPERLEDGSTIWHGYLRDVSDEHSTQLQLDQYRVSLERSNKELEHFAYAASHDLRQPLRMVTSYAQLLERHLGSELDEDATVMLHYMRDGATRMDNMLLSLLDYSRVGRKGQPREQMSLKAAIDEALHFLHPAIEDANAQLTIDKEWPEVYASPDEMTRLFQNLVSNALKYTASGSPVEVGLHITPLLDQKAWQITVSDNGIGIAPDQISRLFKVFQRLHTRDQYDGTGVGLAICRKIVERHGGEITAESDGEGQGSRFVFTLPMLAQQDSR